MTVNFPSRGQLLERPGSVVDPYARDANDFLPIAPGVPATGTGGYGVTNWESPEQYQRWLATQGPTQHEVTAAAEQQASDRNFLQSIQQNTKVENAFKAVAAAKKFQATRRLGNDYQTGVASGLPHAQAMAQAIYRNAIDLWSGSPERIAPAFNQMVQAAEGPFEPGQLSVVTDPRTGKDFGLMGKTSRNQVRVFPDVDKSALTGGQRTTALVARANIIQNELKDAPFNPSDKQKARIDDLHDELEGIRQELKGTATGGIAAPSKVTSGLKLRRKRDGRIFPYRGKAEDAVGDPNYELVKP